MEARIKNGAPNRRLGALSSVTPASPGWDRKQAGPRAQRQVKWLLPQDRTGDSIPGGAGGLDPRDMLPTPLLPAYLRLHEDAALLFAPSLGPLSLA